MAGKAKYDWESLRKLYVSGEVNQLVELSRERTGSPINPPYTTLRQRAFEEDWTEQKKAYYRTLDTKTHTKLTEPSTEQVEQRTQELIDASEAIARHLRLAKALQSVGFQGLKAINIESLSARDIVALIQLGADMERKALALYEPKQQAQIDVEVNFEALSTGELEMVRQAIAKTIPSQVN
ncbi:hypothetical protein [Floridanema evergladense]|uniref:Terminase small subunit n=1 Tax=Floridaenema evergladense BLCC-F167 TaxID=3153639 RepID=A0ABV4WDA4_9CYAN